MSRMHLSFEPRTTTPQQHVMLDVLDPATALIIAEINADEGSAELWDGDRRIARLTRRGTAGAGFWEIAG